MDVLNWANIVDPVNASNDVLEKTCLGESFDTIACGRSGGLAILYICTTVAQVVRIVRMHAARHAECHEYTIFYLGLLQCIVGAAECTSGFITQLFLLTEFSRCMQIICLTHMMSVICARVNHLRSALSKIVIPSCMAVIFAYFCSVLAFGFAWATHPYIDCFACFWLLLHAGSLVLVQLLLVFSVSILVRLHRISIDEDLRRIQQANLIVLITSLELSTLLAFSYHLVLFLLADETIGCSGVFRHRQDIYSSVKIPLDFTCNLLPLWAMLYSLRHFETVPYKDLDSDEDVLVPSSSGSAQWPDPVVVPPPSVAYRVLAERRRVRLSSAPHWLHRSTHGLRRVWLARVGARSRTGGQWGVPPMPDLTTIEEQSEDTGTVDVHDVNREMVY